MGIFHCYVSLSEGIYYLNQLARLLASLFLAKFYVTVDPGMVKMLKPICAIGSINSHDFHIILDGKIQPTVGVYRAPL